MAFKYSEFEKLLKKGNWFNFNLEKSELKDLCNKLKPPMNPSAHVIATEINKISEKKWGKYKKAKVYLEKNFIGLEAALAKINAGPAVMPIGYFAGKKHRETKDGKSYEFILQERGNSCGPACVLIAKQLVHPEKRDQIREGQIRGLMAQAKAGTLHTGQSSIGDEARVLQNWQITRSNCISTIKILKGEPGRIDSAKMASADRDTLFKQLNKCTKMKPAIIGWHWNVGGHFTVCVGPTRDGSELIILDPWTGVETVSNTVDGFQKYKGGKGTLGDAILCY